MTLTPDDVQRPSLIVPTTTTTTTSSQAAMPPSSLVSAGDFAGVVRPCQDCVGLVHGWFRAIPIEAVQGTLLISSPCFIVPDAQVFCDAKAQHSEE
jgi:hypothetical protein